MLAGACDHPRVRVLACVFVLGLVAVAPAAAAPVRTLAWAQAHANHAKVNLTDYYGLTLRFGAVPGSAACAGVGSSLPTNGTKGWSAFECHAKLRGEEGRMFPGSVGARFLLTWSDKVERLQVLSCTGKACPVH
jgi:hypothetical protein